ncbi:MAG: class I SAM-dependent methyltransferase [Thermodesulfobacteriota bacterium]
MGSEGLQVETVGCNFCESKEYTVHDALDGWTIVKCHQCGFFFTNPRPTADGLLSFYSEEYYKDERHCEKFFNNEDGSIKIDELEYNVSIIESHFDNPGKLLEIGAATGGFLRFMKHRGWNVYGVEVSKYAVEIAKKFNRIEMFCGALENFRTDEKFDVICMFQTLEHVPNPAYVIERSYQLLKRNGIIVIQVPNLNGFDIKISKERKRLVYDLPRHLNHFVPDVLEKKLGSTGFKVMDIDLYYPSFVLHLAKLLNFLRGNNTKGSGSNNNNSTAKHEDQNTQQGNDYTQVRKKNKNWKVSLLNCISRVFPGWRFTIVARK